MKTIHGRLLLTLFVGAWLLGLASSGALAGLGLGSSPTDATANSLWNIFGAWQNDENVWPALENTTRTEGSSDSGFTTVWGPTIGTVRQFIPTDNATKTAKPDAWPAGLTWYPLMPVPDGFIGFSAPTVPAEILKDSFAQPYENYESIGYVTVQPDPEDVVQNPAGDPAFDHGVDYIGDEADLKDGTPGINVSSSKAMEVPVPNPDGNLAQCVVPQQDEVQADATNNIAARPATPAVIVTARVPLLLAGVWSSDTHAVVRRIKARIRNAAALYPPSADGKVVGWPAYNVIEIMEEGGKIPPNATRLYVCYYAPGTHYVITQESPLPMPYTVYQVNIADTNAPYLMINDRILHLDPGRIGNLNSPSLTAAACPILGIFRGAQNVMTGTNYFDVVNDPPPTAPAVRYEAPNLQHRTYGKLYFTKAPTAGNLTIGSDYYVVVSTNAVDKVCANKGLTGTDFYRRANGSVIGYCSKSGIIRLGTPLNANTLVKDPDIHAIITGAQLYTQYRKLSSSTFTVGQSGSVGLVTGVSLVPNDPAWTFASKDARPNMPQGRFQIDTKALTYGTYAAQVTYWANYIGGTVVWYKNSIPMRYEAGSPVGGATFRCTVSAGMNMSNPSQQPVNDVCLNLPTLNNKLIYDPRSWPMYYDGGLSTVAGAPTTRWLTASGYGVSIDRALVRYDVKTTDNVTVTVHDSSVKPGVIDYGGTRSNLDYLTCYSDGALPASADVDPLSVEPLEEANPASPDDGSGSTQFVFRARYHNGNNLPPIPWLSSSADVWGAGATGVVLYLDLNGTGDYKPHFMEPDLEDHSLGSNIYMYRVIPHNRFWSSTGPWPFQSSSGGGVDNTLYQSLSIGTFHYFFACSDDSLTFDNGSFAFQNQNPLPMDPTNPASKTGLAEWGQTGGAYSSTALDPSTARAVTGYPLVDRAAHRRYSSDGAQAFDATLYVDRPARAPGEFEGGDRQYIYPSELHPRVTCELHMPSTDDLLIRYDDTTYGFGRFFGTLFPYRSAVNPVHPGSRGFGDQAVLAETSGSYSKDTNVFRIMYKQVDNKAPVSINLWINNASEKTGTDAAHQYVSYTMQRRADQTNPNYQTGVWYEYKLQSGSTELPLGPHTYYFTANDGEHVVRWPVRPDHYIYNASWNIVDWWVPTQSEAFDHRATGYIDNDYVPGPYVNHAPQISNVSVIPGTAKEGAHFVYRATYSDADGQRVYAASITIEVNDQGVKRTFALVPDPKLNIDPNADNSALYKAGVDFILDTATIQDLALQKGVRRFYVEFTDDWGHQDDVNDKREGETVRYPAGDGNWVSGPVISGNSAPTLSNGRVDSVDGTANAATLWTFRANYRDINNDPPALIKLFIGQLQPPDTTVDASAPGFTASKVKTIVWDAGHTMIPSDPTDKVYSDGADFYYQTRLGGPLSGNPAIQYYYAFEAYDGIDYATYKNSSSDNVRSDAAGCFTLQDAERIDETHFKIRTRIAKQLDIAAATTVLDPDPAKVGDIVRIWGVFANEDFTAPNYYDSGGSTPALYAGGTINLNGTLPAGRAWVVCEAETPIVGPLPVEQPAPPGVIPDAEVFKNASSNGAAMLVTDQKNGYVSDTPNLDGTRDRAVVLMGGVAAHDGKPTGAYVAPDNPDTIASVEGVYWLDNPDAAHKYDNYYDAAKQLPDGIVRPVPPAVRQATLLDASTVTLDNPDEVYKVLGVYDNADLTGTNYYAGQGYSATASKDVFLWQPAWVLSTSWIWPTDPMNIVSIKGVYLSMNVNDPAGNFMPPDVKTGLPTPFVPPGGPGFGGEYVTLTKVLTGVVMPVEVFIAYYPAGDLDIQQHIPLATAFTNPTAPAYVKIWAKGFNPGDKYISLTTKLPDITIAATVISSGEVRPTDSKDLADIGVVTGVFIAGDTTNYYTATPNPFQPGDTTVRLGTALPNPVVGAVTITYLPKVRNVTIKYSDMRYTHLSSGQAIQVSDVVSDQPQHWSWTTSRGTTHFLPDGATVHSVNITGNTPDPDTGEVRDVDGGVVGIWLAPDLSGPDYFNPWRLNTFGDNLLPNNNSTEYLRLSTQVPTGTGPLYVRAYQKGSYFIDRWNRPISSDPSLDYTLRFEQSSPIADLDRIQVSYFFGSKMAKVLVPNTLPTLSEGKVAPISGSRNTQYIYSVKYTDIDGPNGQVPAYVRVYIDGVPFDMVSAIAGTPVYKSGAVFTYTPSGGLTGGSHTYHFEASDGAAIAWFDAVPPFSHQTESTQGGSTLGVVDMDGPWVNDPPQLSGGAVTPNPSPGGIGTRESVDYTINLKDPDNDPPYFFDPLRDATGDNVSGSPRLWVDASVNDDTAVPFIGTIVGLEDDPLEPGKQRVIDVKIDDGNGNLTDPTWTPDQFAGKLIQVTNGDKWGDVFPSPYLRVYLVQSNTANKLVIATDTLTGDTLVGVPDDPATHAKRYVQFRFNGLLMTKVDATQENYALGVDYKITVPRLGLGPVNPHKFHFTTRTRETKPLWLLNMPAYTNKDAFSILVRFPTLGDMTGPNVISVTPPGNRAPVMSRIGASTLYRGPKPQYATVISPSRATPSNYNSLLSVVGVFVNANFDAHLAAAQQKDYFDATTINPPATGDPVKLTPNLRALPDTGDLIQHGIATSLLKVTPDVASAIGSVSGVYLAKDPTLATAYLPSSPTLGSDNKIALASALPVGTTDIYIKYKPATAVQAGVADATGDNVLLTNPDHIAYVVGVYTPADTGMTSNLADPTTWVPGQASVGLLGSLAAGTSLVVKYVPWPPVYVKYFAVEPTNARAPIHGVFTAGEPLTFKILYTDADGDAPTYHDGVQGYVQIVFNDTGRTSQMVPMGVVTSYITGVPFGVTLTDVPEGIHPYHFLASDGYVVSRFPADPSGSGANDEKVQVNYKPSLSTGSVDHTSGSVASKFAFSVTYADGDNVAPAAGGFVQVILTNHADATKTLTAVMTTTQTAPNYSTGVRYTVTVNQDGSLVPGQYDTVFVANDGIQDANPLPGPTVVVRPGDNTPPVIVNYQVNKLLPKLHPTDPDQLGNGAGKTSDTFVYSAWYMDVENDSPVYVSPTGQRQTALTLIIDKNQVTEQRVAMTMVPLTQPAPPAPPAVPDYTLAAGVQFQAKVTGKKLGAGNHTYTVLANDGTATSTFSSGIPSSKSGPILMIPFFQISAVGKDGEPITDTSIVGQEVLIKGTMYFPYTVPDESPSGITNITIQVTKPDSTAVSLNASLANIRTSSAVNPQNWLGDIIVKYSGYVDPALITGQSLTLTASGQWVLSAIWPGNTLYDGAETDSTMDGHNDQIRVTVSGPSRTIAVANPLQPDTSTPVVDMITPPMMVPTSPGQIFGYDRALSLQVVKWSPSSGQYFWYDVGGVFPAIMPGDAMWIKPKLGTSTVPGSGYPAAESLGSSYVIAAVPTSTTVVPVNVYASHINGVYLSSSKTGLNYYVYGLAVVPFKSGDGQIVLTSNLPDGTAQVWVDYVASQSGVDEGWITLDSPVIQKAIVAGDPRFVHSKYRMVKVLAQAYPLLTGLSGSPVLDSETQLPLLKPCTVSLSTGWNQFGNIFFNWKKTWQAGTPAIDSGPPPGPTSASVKSPSAQAIDQWNVVPVQPSAIGKVLGVYLNQQLSGTNYYQPGVSTQPYRRGDTMIHLTQAIPATTTTVYIKYEAYPREDVGIPFSEVRVTYLGVTKTLADAKTAGWILDYAWRYDATLHDYVRVSDTVAGAERVLKAWSGYWIRAYVGCQLEIDPNTKFNGVFATAAAAAAVGESSSETIEMPPPAPK